MGQSDSAPRSRTVLVVEDDRATSDLLRTIVEDAGLRFVPASEGHLAVELAVAERPCLITLDLDLPDTDGHAVLHRLLGDERTRAIPVILITGYSKYLPDNDCHRLAAIVAKPFDAAGLGQLMHVLTSGAESAALGVPALR